MGKKTRVERPLRRSDYEIILLTTQARSGWQDLRASIPGPLVDAWEFLTATPTAADGRRCYPLRDDLGTVTYQGKEHALWQYKPTVQGGARIWYIVVEPAKGRRGQVLIREVHTHHPNETK